MTRLDASLGSNADTMHALAAEQHAYAAYEHWAAHYRQKEGEETLARNIGRTAHKISMNAAELSKQALMHGADCQSSVHDSLTMTAD